MRLLAKLTMSTMLLWLVAAAFLATQADGKSVTRQDCVQYASHHQPTKAALTGCMNWAAIHNTCQGAPHCRQWLMVAICESGDHVRSLTAANVRSIQWTIHNGGYEGGVQFTQSTWDNQSTGYAFAYTAPPVVQLRAAESLRLSIGGDPAQSAGWPICGAWF